jgi:hypothetical protein
VSGFGFRVLGLRLWVSGLRIQNRLLFDVRVEGLRVEDLRVEGLRV